MASALTYERVRRDIDAVARAGLDSTTFVAEMAASLDRAVPHVAGCTATFDPATMLLTGTKKIGALINYDEHSYEWSLIEYGDVEPTTFAELRRQATVAAGVHQTSNGDVLRSRRIREFMLPHFGFRDEARVIAQADNQVWGAVALFRTDEPFSDDEIRFLKSLSAALASGLRGSLMAAAADSRPLEAPVGPAVLIVGADDTFTQVSLGAEERLGQLGPDACDVSAEGIVASLVARARQYVATGTGPLPRCRVRLRNGQWFLLHASPLANAGTRTGEVVVTIEEARPPEIVPLIVAAFDLSPRETEVTQLVLQGVDTKDIAATLHMSAYTVQDHLKSVFDKAGVRSRRELLARIFFDQYMPRYGGGVGPSGWFT